LSLCGAHVMPTKVPLEAWGKSGHLNERWCKVCPGLRDASPAQEERSR
jgi:hypothetical protein